ncbi:ABC transporter substrate-binding protein [Pelomonas sp. KK5]|uniref:ABC transporter substrate-binding protein n=1 Tax=Pelomonas sp. KK5 TaxID=1855730 RepID=UPI00097C3955|nr:ABC transporter substrate-binding protein [Pelomonas sp. KK5]
MKPTRRDVLLAGAALAAGLPKARAANDEPIKIGFWPVASGLPLFVGVERGIFKAEGLNVEATKFASAQQVAEAMISGRIHGSANGTASAALALAELANPGLLKIICANPSNHKLVLDEFVVAKDSPVRKIGDLAGKTVGSGPGIQNVTLAKIVLEKNGVTNARVVELPIGQHVAALAAGQLDAVYTLEPTGTAGRLKGLTRVLETGVIASYALGSKDAPWFGGSATVTSSFLKEQPAVAKRYVAAYAKAVDWVRKNPDESRTHLDGFTAIDEALAKEVPLSGFTLYNEFTASDIDYFQKFFDVFAERKIFPSKLAVKPLLYTA